MKINQLLIMFWLVALSFTTMGQSVSMLNPVHNVLSTHRTIKNDLETERGTVSCGTDTVYYTTAKSTQTEIKILFSDGTYASGASQFFPVSSSYPVTVHGFKWYGYSVDPLGTSNPSITVDCSIYLAGSDSLPTGSALATSTLTVDSTKADAEHDIEFISPVVVSQDFVIVLQNNQADHLYIYSNDEDNLDGQGTRLSGTYYEPANEWRNNMDLWAFGDFDYLFSPFITKDVTGDFNLPSTGCVGSPSTFNNTSAGYWNSPIYNIDRFNGNPRDFDWDYGDANTDNNLEDGVNTYATSGTYTVTLDATYNGWTISCTEVVSQSFDVFDPPPAPASTSPAPVCEYTLLADLTASGTGGSFTWYGDSISNQLGTGSPWTSGIVNPDTVWVTETLNGCEGPATEVPLDFLPNPLPTFTPTGLGGLSIQFLGAPGSATSYSWDFDDGNTSTAQEPTHTYLSPGPFNVCVTVDYSNGCQNTHCENFSFLGVDDDSPFNAAVYPNPVESIVTISVDDEVDLELFDPIGRSVLNTNLQPGALFECDMSGMSSGMYLLIISNEKGVSRHRIIKN